MCKTEQIDKEMLKIVIGTFHLFNFVLLADDSSDLPLDEKKLLLSKMSKFTKWQLLTILSLLISDKLFSS